jgi:RHS repeat-associated protein
LTGNGFTLGYNPKDQTSSINGVGQIYADADSTERTNAGATTFTHFLLGLDSATTSGTTRYYYRTPAGLLLGTNQGGTRHWFLRDGEHNIVGVTNSARQRTATYTYGPYGERATATGADAGVNSYRYKSGWQDTSGLIKFGTRYYDAADAHWTQEDPLPGTLSKPSSLNRYQYVNGNPIDGWDPTGRDAITDFLSSVDSATDPDTYGDITPAQKQCIVWGAGGVVLGFFTLGSTAAIGLSAGVGCATGALGSNAISPIGR